MIWIEPRRKTASGETWALNATITLPGADAQIEAEIRFASNNKTFSKFRVGGRRALYYGVYYDDENVYEPFAGGGWLDVAYRTVTFHETPPDALLAWLQSNAVKQ